MPEVLRAKISVFVDLYRKNQQIKQQAEQRVALVIGNSAYQNAEELPNPRNDATALAAALERTGFEVDLETGRVTVVHAHGSCWAGKIVSPLRVRQQNQGCLVFGLGPALFEQAVYDGGQLVNPNLSDYMIPSILDVPARLTSSALESDAPDAELHGVGEMALPGLAPAIANAVFDATGARITDLPLTPERILRALRATRSGARA